MTLQVSEVRPQSSDPDLLKLYPYTFDVVVHSRNYSIAVESEELHNKWLVALRYYPAVTSQEDNECSAG